MHLCHRLFIYPESMRMKTLSMLALLGSTLLWAGCHRDVPTPMPDPCLGTKANPLTFRFLENYGTPTPTAAYSKQTISFEGPGAPYTAYQWQVGADPRSFTQRKLSLYFPERPPAPTPCASSPPPPNTRCFAKDDGVDTLTEVLTMVGRTQTRAAIYGRFWAATSTRPAILFPCACSRGRTTTSPPTRPPPPTTTCATWAGAASRPTSALA